MVKNYTDSLQQLGLSENEASVYVALLGLGRASVQDIASEAGIKRPTTYLVLDELRKKGFVLKEPHTKRSLYTAKDPEEAIQERLLEINKAAKSIPELKAIQKRMDTVNLLYFEGLSGMKTAFNYKMETLKGTSFVGFYAKADEVHNKEFLHFFDEWNNSLAVNNIAFRGIAPRDPSLDVFRKKDKQYGREVKMVPPEKYNSNISIEATASN